jgi:OmpA-OmpF porin, OOP family
MLKRVNDSRFLRFITSQGKYMSTNIIQMLMGLLGQDKIGQIAGMLGESPDAVGKGLGGALPAILGGLIGKGESAGGADAIIGAMRDNKVDGGLLDNLGGLLGSGAQANQLMSSGGGILSSLLGNKAGLLGTALSAFSGLKGGSATSLMGLLAPLVLGAISKSLPGGLNASSLLGLLSGQKDHVKAALPGPLAGVLGLGDLGGRATAAASTVTHTATEDVKKGLGLWPWLLGAGAIAALLFGMKSCKKEEVPTVVAETPAVVEPAMVEPAVVEPAAVVPAVVEPAAVVVPTDAELAKADTDELIAFVKSADAAPKNFVFESLKFDTGKSSLTKASLVTVNNIVKVLGENPNVGIRLEGYTDNVGNPASNMKLSASRAATVASQIVAKGVDAARVEEAGLGDKNPIGDNNTPEGKATNRRIEVVVTKK